MSRQSLSEHLAHLRSTGSWLGSTPEDAADCSPRPRPEPSSLPAAAAPGASKPPAADEAQTLSSVGKEHSSEAAGGQRDSKVCFDFAEGRCHRGDKCRFAHVHGASGATGGVGTFRSGAAATSAAAAAATAASTVGDAAAPGPSSEGAAETAAAPSLPAEVYYLTADTDEVLDEVPWHPGAVYVIGTPPLFQLKKKNSLTRLHRALNTVPFLS